MLHPVAYDRAQPSVEPTLCVPRTRARPDRFLCRERDWPEILFQAHAGLVSTENLRFRSGWPHPPTTGRALDSTSQVHSCQRAVTGPPTHTSLLVGSPGTLHGRAPSVRPIGCAEGAEKYESNAVHNRHTERVGCFLWLGTTPVLDSIYGRLHHSRTCPRPIVVGTAVWAHTRCDETKAAAFWAWALGSTSQNSYVHTTKGRRASQDIAAPFNLFLSCASSPELQAPNLLSKGLLILFLRCHGGPSGVVPQN